MVNSDKKIGLLLLLMSLVSGIGSATTGPGRDSGPKRIRIQMGQKLSPKQREIVQSAQQLLDEASVSYVYGGARLGTETDCSACNDCLNSNQPTPKERLKKCPVCSRCSLDCSHFTKLVFQRAGIEHPYMTTRDMVNLSPDQLRRKFGFLTVPVHSGAAIPGDLLVYKGHVVMLERKHGKDRGDVIHATGGKDIKEPGQGIQRERWADLLRFRGPLLRILRHQALVSNAQDR